MSVEPPIWVVTWIPVFTGLAPPVPGAGSGAPWATDLIPDGTDIMYMCNAPCIIRIMYETASDVESLPFATIKNIRVPIADFDGSNYTVVGERPYYTLVAVISLEDASDPPHDLVRTYSPMSNELILLPPNSVLDGGKWSLETEKSRRFMLFCVEMGNREPHPWYKEFARLPEPVGDLRRLANESLETEIKAMEEDGRRPK